MNIVLNKAEREAFEAAWLNLQRARATQKNMGTRDLIGLLGEVAALATDPDLRPHLVKLLIVADEVTASAQERCKSALVGLKSQELQEKARLVQHHKDVRAEQKAELAEIEGRIDETQADVSLQSEVRSVEVEDIADFRRGVVDTIRVDTGAVVRTRKLEEHERQGRLA